MNMTQSAYILFNVQAGKLEAVEKQLQEIRGITELHALYGIYDLIVKIDFDDMDDLKNRVLNNKIIVDGVKKSMTMICVE